jgi:hemin uptake protein HemP
LSHERSSCKSAFRLVGCQPDASSRRRDLLGGGKEVIILHAGERYRLRVTANDKLILTK